MGALHRMFLTEYHQTWRLFTFPCLHAGAIHLFINLCSVVFIGIHMEQEFGPCKFSFFQFGLRCALSNKFMNNYWNDFRLCFTFFLFCSHLAVRVAIIYLLSAFGGTLVAALFVENIPEVGSSGALYGLLGAMLSGLIRYWRMYTNKVFNLNIHIVHLFIFLCDLVLLVY